MASFFLNNRLLGTSKRPYQWTDLPGHYSDRSIALLCPTCGELWGRIAVPGGNWLAQQAYCHLHPPFPEYVGGSFIPSWRQTYRDHPHEVLIYEFLLHYTYHFGASA